MVCPKRRELIARTIQHRWYPLTPWDSLPTNEQTHYLATADRVMHVLCLTPPSDRDLLEAMWRDTRDDMSVILPKSLFDSLMSLARKVPDSTQFTLIRTPKREEIEAESIKGETLK